LDTSSCIHPCLTMPCWLIMEALITLDKLFKI
jgi:hypothetical protein